jgi:hypothetical protein
MDVASFLVELARHLIRSGATSRQIAALEFAADGRDINVRGCRERRGAYPDLGTIMAGIGPALCAQGVAIGELRRLTFHDAWIGLELVDAGGEARTCSWPLSASLARDFEVPRAAQGRPIVLASQAGIGAAAAAGS